MLHQKLYHGMKLNLMSYGKWLSITSRVTRPMGLLLVHFSAHISVYFLFPTISDDSLQLPQHYKVGIT